MAPTLSKLDRLVAHMRAPARLRRGDIVLIRVGSVTYVKRVAALPGDRIAMVDGVVILNGHAVPQQLVGEDRVEDGPRGTPASRISEQFPGEARPHHILDLGPTMLDELAETTVAPGHVFLLGDHRDVAADSRVSRRAFGLDQVPIGDIVGTARFIYWSGDRSRIGTALGN
jgi:signal peptidase I